MTDKSKTTAPTPEHIAALIDAMDQLLDDMGVAGMCVCALAKAKARVAFEPFIPPDSEQYFMPLSEAERIVQECEDAR